MRLNTRDLSQTLRDLRQKLFKKRFSQSTVKQNPHKIPV